MAQSFADYCRELTETVGKAYQEYMRLQHEEDVVREYGKIKDEMVNTAKKYGREYTAFFGRDFTSEDVERIAGWLRDDGLEEIEYKYNPNMDNFSLTVKW